MYVRNGPLSAPGVTRKCGEIALDVRVNRYVLCDCVKRKIGLVLRRSISCRPFELAVGRCGGIGKAA